MVTTTRRFRTLGALVALTALLTGLVIAVDVAPASATPLVTLSSSTVADGGTVTITASGFAQTHTLEMVLCPKAYLDAGDYSDVEGACSQIWSFAPAPEQVYEATINDLNVSTSAESVFRCSELPDGCAIAAWTASNDLAYAPITVVPPPASITVEPTNVAASQLVTVTLEGFPSGAGGSISRCMGPQGRLCETIATFPNGLPAVTQLYVPGYSMQPQSEYGGEMASSCTNGCVLRAATASTYAETPITIAFPTLVATPSTALADSDVVHVTGVGFKPPTLQLAQCSGGIHYPYRTTECGSQTTVPVTADGRIDATFPVTKSFASVDGVTHTCGTCEVRAFHDTGIVTGTSISFGAAVLTVQPVEPHWDGDLVRMYLTGVDAPTGTVVTFAQCHAPLGVDLASSRCATARTTSTVYGGTAYTPLGDELALVGSITDDAGTIDCHDDSCVIAAFGPDGASLATNALDFEEPTGITLSQDTGLNGGQVNFVVKGLPPNTQYHLATCLSGTGTAAQRCGAPTTAPFTTDAQGRYGSSVFPNSPLTTTSPTRYSYCRAQCLVGVIDGNGTVVREQPITFAEPGMTASPTSGLADGSVVTMSGTFQNNYQGPTVLFPTGTWGVAQCDTAVGDHPSLVDVFVNCAVAPATGNVIWGYEPRSVTVVGTIHKILGGTTDCTASPGACVLAYVRWEQDGTTSFTSTPISFG